MGHNVRDTTRLVLEHMASPAKIRPGKERSRIPTDAEIDAEMTYRGKAALTRCSKFYEPFADSLPPHYDRLGSLCAVTQIVRLGKKI